MDGLFCDGSNPAVGAPNGRLQRSALAKLKWLVERDWSRSKLRPLARLAEGGTRELSPETIGNRKFFFPCRRHSGEKRNFYHTAAHAAYREGSGRASRKARSEAWFMFTWAGG